MTESGGAGGEYSIIGMMAEELAFAYERRAWLPLYTLLTAMALVTLP